MTIYTLVLIKHTNETRPIHRFYYRPAEIVPDVHVFYTAKEAKDFASDWMLELTNTYPIERKRMGYGMLKSYCSSEDLGTVYIQEHTI
tara:strand:+ start:472 stop:735 length:264 start_codon:yes stop_codon:yes gene_type:complete